MKKQSSTPIFQLKVTLRGIRPPIWRRIEVPGSITLARLHYVLQSVMGWFGGHLHQFVVNGEFFGSSENQFDDEVADEKRFRLHQLPLYKKSKFIYEYDFGDGWEHEILVEGIHEAEPGANYPRCLGGKRKCPPEDVGGPWGYQNFLKAIRDKTHPEHEDFLDWIGDDFDPEQFDLEAVNAELQQME